MATKKIPTLYHLAFDQPFRIVRKRKGERRWTNREYAALTRSSAVRWERLVQAGVARRRRDRTLEGVLAWGFTSIADVQRQILADKAVAAAAEYAAAVDASEAWYEGSES